VNHFKVKLFFFSCSFYCAAVEIFFFSCLSYFLCDFACEIYIANVKPEKFTDEKRIHQYQCCKSSFFFKMKMTHSIFQLFFLPLLSHSRVCLLVCVTQQLLLLAAVKLLVKMKNFFPFFVVVESIRMSSRRKMKEKKV
jgi:hypothetical protein